MSEKARAIIDWVESHLSENDWHTPDDLTEEEEYEWLETQIDHILNETGKEHLAPE